MLPNTITISTEEYKGLVALEAKIKAAEIYYNSTQYPDTDTIVGIVGIAPKKRKDLSQIQIPQFVEKNKEKNKEKKED